LPTVRFLSLHAPARRSCDITAGKYVTKRYSCSRKMAEAGIDELLLPPLSLSLPLPLLLPLLSLHILSRHTTCITQ
jgi:hypothetical protein